jgi:hypothetical protein
MVSDIKKHERKNRKLYKELLALEDEEEYQDTLS